MALAGALRTNRALQALYLPGNGIGDEGGAALADALAENVALAELHVDANRLSARGAAALGAVFSSRPAIARPLPPAAALALAMGTHARLGEGSPLEGVPPALLARVAAGASARLPSKLRVSGASGDVTTTR
jgi:hypothetical protein